MSNQFNDLVGKTKEGIGKAAGDKHTENEGRVDQAKSA